MESVRQRYRQVVWKGRRCREGFWVIEGKILEDSVKAEGTISDQPIMSVEKKVNWELWKWELTFKWSLK